MKIRQKYNMPRFENSLHEYQDRLVFDFENKFSVLRALSLLLFPGAATAAIRIRIIYRASFLNCQSFYLFSDGDCLNSSAWHFGELLQFTQAFYILSPLEFTVCQSSQTRKALSKRRPKSTYRLGSSQKPQDSSI